MWALCAAALLSCAPGCGSGRSSDARPESALASSRAAQREFRELHRRWIAATGPERARLEPELRTFLRRHDGDPRARLVRLYLAWVLIERGQLVPARELVDSTRQGPAGSAHDFADVAQAAILRREGRPDRALDLLDPLDGKIVDAEERLLFGEERVRAALAARRHAVAVDYMLRWMADAPAEDREALGQRITQLLGELPAPALERGLSELDAQAASHGTGARAGARDWLRKAVREHLVRVALDKRDAELARRLLDGGPASLRRGERGEELSRLAVSGAVVPRVAGRAIGFVLSLGNPDSRRRSAEAAAGIARALGLPERDSDPGAVRLVTAEDTGGEGGVKRALAALAGDGASVLIAGVDDKGAGEATTYADDAAIPVIVLEPVAAIAADGFAFSVGAAIAAEDALLAEEVARRGAASPARVGPGGVSCAVRAPAAGMPRFPVQTWRRDRVDALLLMGDAACARDAVRELGRAGSRPLLALGLRCGELFGGLESPHERIAVAAGGFPWRADGSAPESMTRWRQRTGRAPSWHAAVAHDAALLAAAAVSDFALERVDDARAVSELHRRARRQLASAEAELWTSERKGFSGGRRLERRLRLIARGAGGSQP